MDAMDNCRFVSNPEQKDTNLDDIGDECVDDDDGDGKRRDCFHITI